MDIMGEIFHKMNTTSHITIQFSFTAPSSYDSLSEQVAKGLTIGLGVMGKLLFF